MSEWGSVEGSSWERQAEARLSWVLNSPVSFSKIILDVRREPLEWHSQLCSVFCEADPGPPRVVLVVKV